MGQRLMQSSSDIFLGWVRGPRGYDFFVRQLRDMKMSVPVEGLSAVQLKRYAELRLDPGPRPCQVRGCRDHQWLSGQIGCFRSGHRQVRPGLRGPDGARPCGAERPAWSERTHQGAGGGRSEPGFIHVEAVRKNDEHASTAQAAVAAHSRQRPGARLARGVSPGAVARRLSGAVAGQRRHRRRDARRLRHSGVARLRLARRAAAAIRHLLLSGRRPVLCAVRLLAPAGDRPHLGDLDAGRRHGRRHGARAIRDAGRPLRR